MGIHRDIKPENILFDKDGHVKLADFGWSSRIKNAAMRTTFYGTPDYLAPEMVKGYVGGCPCYHNESLDMWQMGVLLYEMLVGKSPFGASTQDQTFRLILRGNMRFPRDTDSDAKDLVLALCQQRPENRLTAAQAKEHAFVTKLFGGPVLAEPTEEELNRPSVMVRYLKPQIEMLQGEKLMILQAKSQLEDKHMNLTRQLHSRKKKRICASRSSNSKIPRQNF